MRGEHHAAAAGGLGGSLAGFGEILRIRDFRLLFVGQAASALGDWVGTLAFIAAADHLAPDRPAAVAVVLILRLLPSFFATPIGGVLSDRWDRKRLMVASDLIRFGIIALVPFVPKLGVLYALAFGQEIFSLFFLPARDASLPNLVPKERLEPANALIMGSSFGAIPLSGPIFALLALAGAHFPSSLPGAFVFHERPWAFAFAFDALTFLVSAWLIQRMTLPDREPDGQETPPMLDAARQGARYVMERPLLRGLAAAVSFGMLGGGVLFALGIGYVHDTLGGGNVEFGWLMGLFGAGMVLGFVISQAVRHSVIGSVRASLLAMGAILAFMAVFATLWIAYLTAVGFGAAFSVSLIVAMSAVQAHAADAFRGRVMGFVHMLVRGALSVGALVSAGVASLVGERGLGFAGADLDKNQFALLVAGGLIGAGSVSVRRAGAGVAEAANPQEAG
ncbi:MAG TPA: MFS transporter [Actinomycetota bacterium]